jgi:hypothetical protein
VDIHICKRTLNFYLLLHPYPSHLSTVNLLSSHGATQVMLSLRSKEWSRGERRSRCTMGSLFCSSSTVEPWGARRPPLVDFMSGGDKDSETGLHGRSSGEQWPQPRSVLRGRRSNGRFPTAYQTRNPGSLSTGTPRASSWPGQHRPQPSGESRSLAPAARRLVRRGRGHPQPEPGERWACDGLNRSRRRSVREGSRPTHEIHKNEDVRERKIKNKDLFAYMACPPKGYGPKWHNLTSLGC